jgi:predicted nucleic acid-binding protein
MITIPSSGLVYLDANSIIYSVEKHPIYCSLLDPVWLAAQGKTIEIVSSELVLMETLVGPLKAADAALALEYEQLFQQAQTRLLPVTRSILRDAAKLRATTNLKTPDAIHGATGLRAGCALFVTNDRSFRSVAGLSVVVLDDLRTP